MMTLYLKRLFITSSLILCCFSNFLFADSYYDVTDSFGKHRLQKPPERVVVTDWALLEQILELGITPVGAPEIERYHHYVRQPPLPSSIIDIGLRHSPDLQMLRSLKPDAIIIGTDQKALARPFSRIAPVLYYNNFSEKYRTNGKKTRERFLQLADLFQRRTLAEKKLAAMDEEIKRIRNELYRHFAGKPPKVTLIRFSSEEKVLVYGGNSIPLYTIERLGLVSGAAVGRSKWGYKEVPIAQLRYIAEDTILYIEPLEVSDGFFLSESWLSLPAALQNRMYSISPAWSYGGAMSVLYTARAIHSALLALPRDEVPILP